MAAAAGPQPLLRAARGRGGGGGLKWRRGGGAEPGRGASGEARAVPWWRGAAVCGERLGSRPAVRVRATAVPVIPCAPA